MTRIVLATALVTDGEGSDARVLLVASRYANHAQPLWNLPGGRQRPGELLFQTAQRECFEETGLRVRAGALAYVSESYDPNGVHVINATFYAERIDAGAAPSLPSERGATDHVAEVRWMPFADVAAHVVVEAVRAPLLACLQGRLEGRYASFENAGITIEWPSDCA